MFEGVSPIELAKDLEISDGDSENEDPRVVSITTNSHSEDPKVVSIATNIDTSGITKTKEGTTNTTPDVRITLSTQQDVYLRTFGNKDLGLFKIPKKEYNTQLGYLDSVQIHNTACQTDVKSCIECNRHDHMINSRWRYWVNDAKTNCNLNSPTIYQSREDYHKLPLFNERPKQKGPQDETNKRSTSETINTSKPHRLNMKKSVKYDPLKLQRFRESLKPKSPFQIAKPNILLSRNHNNSSTQDHKTKEP